MDFKTILGLLGLLGIIILILIYIIKPNYQQKTLSSTYVWKQSLKYRRRRLPSSRFRQLLIVICQVLVISICAFVLAQPFVPEAVAKEQVERVVIIDASASMLASKNDSTRFEKAVAQVKTLAEEIISQNGLISIILAGKDAEIISDSFGNFIEKVGLDESGEIDPNALSQINDALDKVRCTYGVADIDGAMLKAENIIIGNPFAKILLYTATTYTDLGDNVELKDISEKDEKKKKTEWNAAILDVSAVLVDNFYEFTVKIASYNKNTDLTVQFEANDVNFERNISTESINVSQSQTKTCLDNETVTVKFRSFDLLKSSTNSDGCIFSYDNIHIWLEENGWLVGDTFFYDNDFHIYGGSKETLKVLYASSLRNTFFGSFLRLLRDTFNPLWHLDIDEVNLDDEPELTGYDFYVFEHKLPQTLPTDGVILISDPDITPFNLDIGLGGLTGDGKSFTSLSRGESTNESSRLAQILANVNPARIMVSQYTPVADPKEFVPLMYCGSNPVFLVKDASYEKIAILSFGLNYSNLSMLPDFPALMRNLFDYFFPVTLTKYVYDVDEQIKLNARASTLDIDGEIIDGLPCEISLSAPGTYTVKQQLPLKPKETVVDYFFVRIPASESDFSKTETFYHPQVASKEYDDWDLLIFFASALVAFLIAERLLHLKSDV